MFKNLEPPRGGKSIEFPRKYAILADCTIIDCAKFWKHDISSASGRAFWGFLAIFLVAQLSPKRGVLVQKDSLASCQRCRHSVEPRALSCPFKHSDLIAWSLLSWHPTHKYLWGRLCFVQACCLLSTITVTPAETRIMSTEALLSKTVSVKIPQSAWAPGSHGTKQLETVATMVIASTESFILPEVLARRRRWARQWTKSIGRKNRCANKK